MTCEQQSFHTQLAVEWGCVWQAQLSDIEALVERVREARLRDIVKQGIGYLHEGMHPGDQDIMHTLFQSGAIQVRPSPRPSLLPCCLLLLFCCVAPLPTPPPSGSLHLPAWPCHFVVPDPPPPPMPVCLLTLLPSPSLSDFPRTPPSLSLLH